MTVCTLFCSFKFGKNCEFLKYFNSFPFFAILKDLSINKFEVFNLSPQMPDSLNIKSQKMQEIILLNAHLIVC